MQLSAEVIYLVGNKTDLVADRKVSYELGKKVSRKFLICLQEVLSNHS